MTKKTTLANGICVITTENPRADIIAGRLFFRSGSCRETTEQSGLSHLLAAVMMKGTKHLSALDIANQVESVGASLGTEAATDYFLVYLKSVTKDFLPLLELAAEIVRSPSLPPDQIELERRLTLQRLKQAQEQPMTVAFEAMRQLLYQAHPYAASTLGNPDSVSNLQREDLEYFHQAYFRPDNLIISVAGNITHPEHLELIEQVFGDWQAPIMPMPELVLPPVISRPQAQTVPQATQQAIVMLGYLAAPVRDPHYAAFKLLSAYLSNGLSSRLFVELREKQGLAYEVSTLYPTRIYTSAFIAYLGTAPANQEIALTGLTAEIDRLAEISLSSNELQTTKNKILGQYALGKQTNAQLAQTYGWYEALGLGIEFDQQFIQGIEQLTTAEIQTTAQKYLQSPYTVIVGTSNQA
ncbi:MAG: insulinase family protein [Coleofasciculaceae cyanobacterium SM2_1_6]|nr:insulinase family protein [Coleofasciculaceae cyanobacterium SM2_1_6]